MGLIFDRSFDRYMDSLAQFEDEQRVRDMGISYPACSSGPCNGGRRLCVTPEACQIAESDLPIWQRWFLAFAKRFE